MKKCIKCLKTKNDSDFHKNSSYCKRCKAIIESKRRYNKKIKELEFNNLDLLYKYQRSFLNQLVSTQKRDLEFCSIVMEYNIEQIKSALVEIGYHKTDYLWCSNCAFYKHKDKFWKASNRKKSHQDWCYDCKHNYYTENREKIDSYRIDYYNENKERLNQLSIQNYYDNYEHYRDLKQKYQKENSEYFKKLRKEYYVKNKEEILKKQKEYYHNNFVEISNKSKLRYEENKSEIIPKVTEYRKKNPEKVKTFQKRYRENNPDKLKEHFLRRKYQINQATVSWANKEKIKEIYKERNRLIRETGLMYNVDHIIPLLNDKVCGLHVENNLQIIKDSENFIKNNKFESIIEYF